MSKIIWASDLHFTANGDVQGFDPRIHTRSMVDFINDVHADADFCIISGDMVNHGSDVDYQALASALSRLTVPYFPMVGNHDSRGLFRNHLAVPSNAMEPFVQYSVQKGSDLFICLDTLQEGHDYGAFCQTRLSWLDTQLANATDKSVYIFMHHPPMELGLPMQDQDRNFDGEKLLALLGQHTCVKHMFIGHVHRPMAGTITGIPFATMRSVLYQAPPPRPVWDWDSFAPADEAPNIGVITTNEGDVTLEYVNFNVSK